MLGYMQMFIIFAAANGNFFMNKLKESLEKSVFQIFEQYLKDMLRMNFLTENRFGQDNVRFLLRAVKNKPHK
jgi:hypothetical protein